MAATTAVLVGSLVIAEYQAEQQEKFQERQAGIQRAQSATQRFAQRRRALREQRIRSAQIQQAAENSGASGSSAVLSGVGALSTDFAVNQSVLNTEERLGQEMLSANKAYNKSVRNSAIASSLLSAGSSAYQGYQKNQQIAAIDKKLASDKATDDIFRDDYFWSQ